jgi:hypothetical protein
MDLWRYNEQYEFVNDFNYDQFGELKHLYNNLFWIGPENNVWIRSQSNPKYLLCLSLLRVYALIIKDIRERKEILDENIPYYKELFAKDKFKCIDECEYCGDVKYDDNDNDNDKNSDEYEF